MNMKTIRLKLDNGNCIYTCSKRKLHSSNDYNYINGKNIFKFEKIENDIYIIKGHNNIFLFNKIEFTIYIKEYNTHFIYFIDFKIFINLLCV